MPCSGSSLEEGREMSISSGKGRKSHRPRKHALVPLSYDAVTRIISIAFPKIRKLVVALLFLALSPQPVILAIAPRANARRSPRSTRMDGSHETTEPVGW
ncbi:uncharacterized protein K489DRAFT_374982 [Dissoconium aciculare CBS 342.82]|uniref:Uncharacterized protein n=1 Tax=Dissoconium aciculare CBS 342.82 TaxID=1314786 RepID=A0A6J3MJ03_9PEZI|nr:uncharacterized protein K489DRAFT_374982 [Dissoconium aciculare CBS 342.82]KAF1826897.1 hypothetical protein K489DRAFT_374982 [Dissoconium aciculare CBS 342.82]